MPKLKVKKVVMFKHGVSYFILDGTVKGIDKFELEFKTKEMNDALKSLFVLDTSEKGFISSISFDAALDTSQLLSQISLDVPDVDSFSSILTQIKGAKINLTVGTAKKISGTVMGIELLEKFIREERIEEKLLVLLTDDNNINKIPFTEISSYEVLNEDLKKDLKFFLDTVISGKKKDTKSIIIHCESGGDDEVDREVIVSYIRESPIWKTSYRIIMSKQQAIDKKCLLSGWCVVENTTNDDWEDVVLSLVAGMPVSFTYDFYRPIFIQRPVITPPKVLSAKPIEIEEGIYEEEFDDYAPMESMVMATEAERRPMAPSPKKKAKALARSASSGFGAMGGMGELNIMDKVQAQATVSTKDMGELFEYNISNPVTIKRKHSALVPIVSEEIKAKKILLYNMHENNRNPNACLEITNSTELMLERGPVTIIYDENLAGEAIVPFLNKEDTRILNYAIEQAVLIDHEDKSESRKVHRVTLSGHYCYEYYYTHLKTEYKIQNKTKEEKELYLDHPKQSNYKIIESSIEPEETPNYHRFKLNLKPKDAVVFKIEERMENYSSYYLWNWDKEYIYKKVEFYLSKKFIDEKVEAQLKELGELLAKLSTMRENKEKLISERDRMEDEQSRIRENIAVLGESSQENALREKYVKKFAEQEERFESIVAEIESLDKEIEVLNKEISEKMDKIRYG